MKPETEAAIRAHAVRDYPNEACGLVAVVKGKERYLECRNVAPLPRIGYILSPQDWAKAEELGEIVAVVHSHPDSMARASEGDLKLIEAMQLPWYIVHVSKLDGLGEITATEINRFDPCGWTAPLIGRQFFHGVLDCYELIKDYYDRELSITLPHFERQDGWWESGEQDLYMENFAAAGFAPINGLIQRHDVIIMQYGHKAKKPNHAGVYIGDGLMLHHMHNRLSSRDLYSGQFQEVTRVIVRHKELSHA